MQKSIFTVGDLRNHLKLFPDNFELTFGPDDRLTFYRTKQRGDKMVNIEFNEIVTVAETEPYPSS